MTRFLLAGALACALSAAACTPQDAASLSAAVNSGTLAPTLQPGTLTPANLTAAGVTQAQQAKIFAAVAKAQSVARTICPFVPVAEGLANVAIASVASGAAGQTVAAGVNVVCRALTTAPTYAALGDRRGEMVTAYVRIGRFDRVPVYGIRAR